MKATHISLILCGVSVILFSVALRPWLPFYAADADSVVLRVKVTLDGNPVGNTKVDVYDLIPKCFQSPPIPNIDPATLGSPIKEGFTDNSGEIEFMLNCGNYTVRIENEDVFKWKFAIDAIFLTEPEQEVGFTFCSVRTETVPVTHPASTLSYLNVGMLCAATTLMASGVIIFAQSRRK
jgi:hypothetical protein